MTAGATGPTSNPARLVGRTMTAPAPRAAPPWRVAVTRDEAADGPLSRALAAAAFVPCRARS